MKLLKNVMTHYRLLSVLGASTLFLSIPLVGCGGYAADPPMGTGGADSASGGADSASGGADSASGGDNAGSGGREEVPPASCENAEACGGDPVSVWFAMDSCLTLSGTADLSLTGIGCKEGLVEGTMDINGNFTLNADGTVSDNSMTIVDMSLELENQCLQISGTVSKCDRLGDVIAEQSGATSVDCVDSTVTEGGCTCAVHYEQSGAMGYPQGAFAATAGTYTNMDNTLSVRGTVSDASPGPSPLNYGFCVDGNFMHVTASVPSPIWSPIKGEIVLQRQD